MYDVLYILCVQWYVGGCLVCMCLCRMCCAEYVVCDICVYVCGICCIYMCADGATCGMLVGVVVCAVWTVWCVLI